MNGLLSVTLHHPDRDSDTTLNTDVNLFDGHRGTTVALTLGDVVEIYGSLDQMVDTFTAVVEALHTAAEQSVIMACGIDGCDSPAVAHTSYWPGSLPVDRCADHDAAARAEVAAYEATFVRHASPWS